MGQDSSGGYARRKSPPRPWRMKLFAASPLILFDPHTISFYDVYLDLYLPISRRERKKLGEERGTQEPVVACLITALETLHFAGSQTHIYLILCDNPPSRFCASMVFCSAIVTILFGSNSNHCLVMLVTLPFQFSRELIYRLHAHNVFTLSSRNLRLLNKVSGNSFAPVSRLNRFWQTKTSLQKLELNRLFIFDESTSEELHNQCGLVSIDFKLQLCSQGWYQINRRGYSFTNNVYSNTVERVQTDVYTGVKECRCRFTRFTCIPSSCT